jgi:hypothetical protein
MCHYYQQLCFIFQIFHASKSQIDLLLPSIKNLNPKTPIDICRTCCKKLDQGKSLDLDL